MSVSSVCPHCFKTDGYLNVGRSHIGVCDTHRVKWDIGANLFSDWKYETQADWDRNEQQLAGYTQVEAALDPEMLASDNPQGSEAVLLPFPQQLRDDVIPF